MAAILRLLLDEVVSPQDLISWLTSEQNSFTKLNDVDNDRCDFVPYFLNYLRDQSNRLVQSSQNNGLTPVKTFTLCPRRNTGRTTAVRSRNSPRMELFPVNNSCGSFAKRQQNETKANQTTTSPNSELKSQQKLCLGQFMPSSGSTVNNLRKKTINTSHHKEEALKNKFVSSRQKSRVDLNLTDLNAFPPVGSSSFLIPRKKKFELTSINKQKNENEKKSEFIQHNNEKTRKIFHHSVNMMETIVPCPDKVTSKKKLDILIDVYTCILNENLMPNLSVELYFLVQLLTVKIELPEQMPSVQDGELINLATVHNCVYFAAKVLSNQIKILLLLDKATQRLLADNLRFSAFEPEARLILSKNCEQIVNGKVTVTKSTIASVSFQSDTDNRNNFSGDQAFDVFRKQRDLFYETLREWENYHMNPDWSFSVSLGNKVRQIVNMWMDPVIYSHLARLFVSQMIATCKGNFSQNNSAVPSPDLPYELLANLECNPEKFKRLNKRFVTPSRVDGPSPPPAFTGVQEFFRDFIVFASCSMFNQHLIDTIVYKIHELNGKQFNLPEKDHSSASADETLKQEFISTLFTMRLLGKFLGLIVFFPYHTMERLPQGLQEDYAISRNKVPLVIDIIGIFEKAYANHRITLSIPCLVEFLSMMDECGHLVSQVQIGLKVLIRFYKSMYFKDESVDFTLNRFLVFVLMGWLFETPNFPTKLFFVPQDDDAGFASGLLETSEVDNLCFLDALDLVDHHVLYTCCPYLGELKVILTAFAAGTGSKTSSIKKIIPVLTDNRIFKTNKLLQLQLEENFFHNQPASIKKVVDFVVERMASNIIKFVRKESIKKVETKSLTSLHEFIAANDGKPDYKDRLKRTVHQLAMDGCIQLKIDTDEFANSYCEKRIEKTIQLLMSEETAAEVTSNCVLVAIRQTKEKVSQWMSTQVTIDFFLDDLYNEVEKYQRSKTFSNKLYTAKKETAPSNNYFRKQTIEDRSETADLSLTDLAIRLKLTTRDLYSVHEIPSSEFLDKLINDIHLSLSLIPSEWTVSLWKYFSQLSLEFICGLVVLKPDLVSEGRVSLLAEIWSNPNFSSASSPLSPVICCRTFEFFVKFALNSKAVWIKLAWLILYFLKNKLMSPQELIDQCLLTLKQEWPQEALKNLSMCLQRVIDGFKSVSKDFSGEDFVELLDWIAWLCQNAEEDLDF